MTLHFFSGNGQGTLFPWNHRYPHAIRRTKALGALVQGTRLSEFKLRMLLVTGDVLQNDPLWWEALRYDSKGVSCCPPAMYAERFNQFMKNAIA